MINLQSYLQRQQVGHLIYSCLGALLFVLISVPVFADSLLQTGPTTVEALGSISGTVTNAAGEPLAGIEVYLDYRYANYYESPIVTDSQGRYQINHLRTSLYIVVFNDPNDRFSTTYSGNVRDREQAQRIPITGNQVTDVDVTMLPIIGVSGTLSLVEELTDGSFEITAHRRLENEETGHVLWPEYGHQDLDITDTEYLLSLPEPGLYRVCVNVRGYTEGEDIIYSPYGPLHSRRFSECYNDVVSGIKDAEDIRVAETGVTKGIDFVLGSSSGYGAISGTVTNNTGDPLEGVRVMPYPPPSYYHNASVSTDENGRYSLDALIPTTVTLYFDAIDTKFASEYYSSSTELDGAQELVVEPGSRLENIDAQLALGGIVSGELTLEGQPVREDVKISLFREAIDPYYPDDETNFVYFSMYEDAYDTDTGKYTIEGLPSGNYKIRARMPDDYAGYSALDGFYGGPNYEDAIPFGVELGETTSDVDIIIAESMFDGAIEGTVTSSGVPLPGIWVQLFDSYYFDCGSYYYFDCEATNDPSFDAGLISYGVSDENGAYSIGGLTAGTYAIRFLSPDGEYVTSVYKSATGDAGLLLERGATIAEISGELDEASTVSGAVYLTDGAPASNYAVVVERQTDSGPEIVRSNLETDDKGYYEISSLPAGNYTLRFLPKHSYLTHLRLNVTVAPGEQVTGLGGIAGPGVPTSLPAAEEPVSVRPTLTEVIFVPLMIQ